LTLIKRLSACSPVLSLGRANLFRALSRCTSGLSPFLSGCRLELYRKRESVGRPAETLCASSYFLWLSNHPV